jgi:hypothetical protein
MFSEVFKCVKKMRTVVELKAGLSSGDSQENIRALLEIRYGSDGTVIY